MTPEPLRGALCGPEHVVWTADKLCEVRGADTPEARAALLAQLYANATVLLDRAPTPGSAPGPRSEPTFPSEPASRLGPGPDLSRRPQLGFGLEPEPPRPVFFPNGKISRLSPKIFPNGNIMRYRRKSYQMGRWWP